MTEGPQQPPRWALDAAGDDMLEGGDDTAVQSRAREIVREAETLEDERHDEYDDPDEGGEG